jgi:heme/copper-type cytochrome/quinol oxidase subunit 2
MIAWKDFAMDDTYFLSLTMFLGVRLVLFWCVGKYSRNRESK